MRLVALGIIGSLVGGCGFESSVPADAPPPPRPDAEDSDPAPSIDAARTFDLSTCPAGYTAITNAPSTSRYRITTDKTFWQHHLSCNTAIAHLAIVDAGEAAALRAATSAPILYVGAVEQRAGHGWIDFAGKPITLATDDLGENVGALDASGALVDVVGTELAAAICECDGSGIAQIAIDAIGDDPNNL